VSFAQLKIINNYRVYASAAEVVFSFLLKTCRERPGFPFPLMEDGNATRDVNALTFEIPQVLFGNNRQTLFVTQ